MSTIQNSEIAISVKGLFKSFKLPHEQHNGIKQLLVNRLKGVKGYEIQHVLEDITFDIKKGEFFGIVGRNGSGKSTLLKILSGIYTPDKGNVHIKGSLTPFIELGVGFNPELTGRENVFLNGALLGFSRKEIDKMYNSIVEFAELDKFMDQKLKNYSSGMQVRLAFSIAIKAESDILILDEVLAVGDQAFQRKCTDYFMNLKKSGQTIILVTHDMNSVERFCDRVLILDSGRNIGIYSPHKASNIYSNLNTSTKKNKDKQPNYLRWGTKKTSIGSIEINGKKTNLVHVKHGEEISINTKLTNKLKTNTVLGLGFYDESGLYISGPNSGGVVFKSVSKLTYVVDKFSLNPGLYTLEVALFNNNLTEEYDHILNAKTIIVDNDNKKISYGKIELFGKWSSDK